MTNESVHAECAKTIGERNREIERLNRKCSALALLLYGPNPNAVEPCEQQAIAEDVRLLGIGFAMHTAVGVKRLAPEAVTLRTRLRCLAMINEFGDKVCSLPESHGGPHVWVTPEKSGEQS